MTVEEIKQKVNTALGKNTLIDGTISYVDTKDIISTGSIGFDKCLGIGGFLRGRIVELLGQESSGKTTCALHIIANAQKQGIVCSIIDVEHALDAQYAENLGVDVEKLLISQPDYGEAALEVIDQLLDTKSVGVIVVDSVAALVPKAELEGEFGAANMGLQARMMSQALRKLTGKVAKANCLVIFINQFREKLGIMFGDNKVPAGGNSLKFYASVRVEISRSVTTKNSIVSTDGDKLGNLTTIKVLKNKLAPPFKQTSFYLNYGKGIDVIKEIIEFGTLLGLITKEKRTYYIRDQKIGAYEELVQFLEDNTEFCQELKSYIINELYKTNQSTSETTSVTTGI